MSFKDELKVAREQLRLLSLYQRFEQIVVLVLTALIAVIVVAALWSLCVKVLSGLLLSGSLVRLRGFPGRVRNDFYRDHRA
jgi:hypothetical protein